MGAWDFLSRMVSVVSTAGACLGNLSGAAEAVIRS